MAVEVSPDGTRVATLGWDHSVRLSETAGFGPVPMALGRYVRILASEHESVLITNDGGGARLWADFERRAVDRTPRAKTWNQLAFGPTAGGLAGLDELDNLFVCLGGDCKVNLGQGEPLLGKVRNIAAASAAERLIFYTDQMVRVVDGQLSTRLEMAVETVGVGISPHGNFVSVQGKKEVLIVAVQDGLPAGKVVHRLPYSGGLTVCFDPEERWVAVASTEQEFAVLGLGKHVSPLVNTHRYVSCDAKRPYLATINAKTRSVDVVNMDSGARVTTLPHDLRVNDVAFDRSGKFIATVSEDNFVHLWTLEGREVVRRAALDPQYVIFSTDNSLIISSDGEQVQFHPWQTQDLLREARKRLRPVTGH
jgi:WD40 repeat protein